MIGKRGSDPAAESTTHAVSRLPLSTGSAAPASVLLSHLAMAGAAASASAVVNVPSMAGECQGFWLAGNTANEISNVVKMTFHERSLTLHERSMTLHERSMTLHEKSLVVCVKMTFYKKSLTFVF